MAIVPKNNKTIAYGTRNVVSKGWNGGLYLYYGYEEPYKGKTHWDALTSDYLELDKDMFPEVKWSDNEPTKVKLEIDK